MEALLTIVPLTVQWLLCLMMVEILTAALLDPTRSETVSILEKKLGMLVVVSLGYVLDGALAPAIALAEPIASFYIIVQALAIVENLRRLGIPLPAALIRTLKQMRG
jgi:phage-related holin